MFYFLQPCPQRFRLLPVRDLSALHNHPTNKANRKHWHSQITKPRIGREPVLDAGAKVWAKFSCLIHGCLAQPLPSGLWLRMACPDTIHKKKNGAKLGANSFALVSWWQAFDGRSKFCDIFLSSITCEKTSNCIKLWNIYPGKTTKLITKRMCQTTY